jgi:hypothetical protein
MVTCALKRARLTMVWAAASIVTGMGLGSANAQVGASSTSASNGASIAAPAPPLDGVGPGLAEVEPPQASIPAALDLADNEPEEPFGWLATGPFGVIRESIFGAAAEDEWTPLELRTFFSDGWDRPYVKAPAGTKGAPKQNWFGAADGIFVRLNAVNFFFTDGMTKNNGLLLSPFPWAPTKPDTNGNQYWASNNLYLPLNQRLELLVVAPFIASNTTSPTGHYVGNFGDLTISERFRLIEHRNFSLQALLTERTPTGKTVNGNDINFVTPSVEFWTNFAPGWVFRGGTGINIDTGRTSSTDTYFTNFAIGRYLTSKDARFFKSMVAHVAVSTMSDILGRKDYITDCYVAPGLRFGLGPERKWAVLGAIQVPVTGPHPYAYQLNFGLARNY